MNMLFRFFIALLPLVLACSGNTLFDRQVRPDWGLPGQPAFQADRLLVVLHSAAPEMPLVTVDRAAILVTIVLSEADYVGFTAVRVADGVLLYSESFIRVRDSADGIGRTLGEFAGRFAGLWRERFRPAAGGVS